MKKHEQDLTWGDVMWAWIKKGVPREEAVFQADEFMRRREKERFAPSRNDLARLSKSAKQEPKRSEDIIRAMGEKT